METTKISDNEIKVVKSETVNKENVFSIEFLTEQRARIEKQKDNEIIQRDLELEEIDSLLAECLRLGVRPKLSKE